MTIRDVPKNHRTRTNSSAGTDAHARKDRCTGAHKCQSSDAYTTAECRIRCDMGELPDRAVVIYNRPVVYNGTRSNSALRTKNRMCSDKGAQLDRRGGRCRCHRVDDRRRSQPGQEKLV